MTDPNTTYFIALGVAVVMLIISVCTSLSISFRPDRSDVGARKLWFWVFAVITPLIAFAALYFLGYIKVPHTASKQAAFMKAMCISSAVAFVFYVVVGFILAKLNKHGKLGNWF